MKYINYTDLVMGADGAGVKWKRNGRTIEEGLDCKGLTWICLDRSGVDVAEEDLLLGGEVSATRWMDHDPGKVWHEIGTEAADATMLGDVVVTHGREGLHIMPLVDEKERLVLSIRKTGGVHTIRLNLLDTVVAVLRHTNR